MTDTQINQLILKELRELRSSFNLHAEDTGRRLTALETQMDPNPVSRSKPRSRRALAQ